MKRLTTPGSDYRSPDTPVSPVARLFPSLSFYGALAPIVWRSSTRAKRGRYGSAEWVQSSHDVPRALDRGGVGVEGSGGEDPGGVGVKGDNDRGSPEFAG